MLQKTKMLLALAGLLLAQLPALLAQPAEFPCQCIMPACSGAVHNLNYSDTAGWTTFDSTPGKMILSGGVMNYLSPAGGNYGRMYTTLSNLSGISNNFVAECRINVTGGNAPGHYVMAFTSSTLDPLSTNGPGYTRTNNDALAVILTDVGGVPGSSSCCTNPTSATRPWVFRIMAKDNNNAPVFSDSIRLNSSQSATYYVRLIRSSNWTHLAVFSDANFTVNIPGSPVCFFIPSNISNLQRLHHGVITWGSTFRTLQMTLDDTKICTYTGGCVQPEAAAAKPHQPAIEAAENAVRIQITPNPSRGNFTVKLTAADDVITGIVLYDASGRRSKVINNLQQQREAAVNAADLVKGIYVVEVQGRTGKWRQQVVLE